MYKDAIHNGLHGLSGNIINVGRGLNDNLRDVARDIMVSRKRCASAGRGEVYLWDRKDVSIGTDPLIPIVDCEQYKNYPTGYQKCLESQQNDPNKYWKGILNTHLERASHHSLYEFMSDTQAKNIRPTQFWKIGAHQQSVSIMSSVSGLSRSNIVEWHRLGIMRHNALKGAGALPPEMTIKILQDNIDATFDNVLRNQTDPETGGMVSVGVIPVAAWIIFACAAALAGIAGVIQAINKQEPTALDRIAGIGTALFSAQGSDRTPVTLPPNGGNNGNNGGGVNPPINTPSWFEENKGLVIGGAVLVAGGLILANQD
jgi:hypothetical protein